MSALPKLTDLLTSPHSMRLFVFIRMSSVDVIDIALPGNHIFLKFCRCPACLLRTDVELIYQGRSYRMDVLLAVDPALSKDLHPT